MKSNFLKIFMIALLPIFAVSCIDNKVEVEDLPRDPVSFEYYIEGDYHLDYYETHFGRSLSGKKIRP